MFALNTILSVLEWLVMPAVCTGILVISVVRKDPVPGRERVLLLFDGFNELGRSLSLKAVIQGSNTIYTLPCSCIGRNL